MVRPKLITTVVRLCRLMCGKALPFRERSFIDPRGYASNSQRGVASQIDFELGL